MGDEHDLEMIAAALRQDARDSRVHGQAVLDALAAALPAEIARVERAGGVLRKTRVIGVQVSVGEHRYVLHAGSIGLESAVCHESGGIVLSTTPVGFDEWVRALLDALAAAAGRSAVATLALRNLAITGNAEQ